VRPVCESISSSRCKVTDKRKGPMRMLRSPLAPHQLLRSQRLFGGCSLHFLFLLRTSAAFHAFASASFCVLVIAFTAYSRAEAVERFSDTV